jgi:hypothetical protein
MVTLARYGQHAVIGAVMRLEQEYDPAQFWLPFVAALIRHPPPPLGPTASSVLAIHRLQQKTYVTPRRRDSTGEMYAHVAGVPQIELPFEEYRLVPEAEWRVLSETGYPAWDLLDGHPPTLHVGGLDTAEVRDWLLNNCRGRFRLGVRQTRSVRFERLRDFAMAKLRFI